MNRLRVLAVALLIAAGCGSAETKEDRPDPVSSRLAEDPPGQETEKTPPLGRPRAKVPPSSEVHKTDLRASDSLYRDETPH